MADRRIETLNNARMLMESALTNSEPSYIGDAIDRVAAAYNIPPHILGFITDAYHAKARMYDGDDASLPLATALVWLDAARKPA